MPMNRLSDDHIRHLRELIGEPDLAGTQFELIREIAVGGMGTVYLVRDRELERPVALKVLSVPDGLGALTARIIREAKTVAQLEHPGIVPVHAVGRLPDGRVYYAMKFVEGKTLDEFRRTQDSLSVLLRIFEKICETVQFAHSRGVLHRDLKPSNIMVGPFGEVLVMDWGIATRVTESAQSPVREADVRKVPSDSGEKLVHTAHGTVLGTPAYMSPEQAQGRIDDLDCRTDVYGLGAILYFLLTGKEPYSDASVDAILARVAAGELRRPRDLSHAVPKRLEATCLKAMARDPERRYDSAAGLASDVTLYLDGQPVSAYRESVVEKSARWLGRNQFVVFVILAYIIVRLIILFWRGV
ncbi:MAG: serine/threonine protein kinase [candidate division Zixibacteria bacterium]|nr:serine/threonine protein kinase [candidate division Zixibacteria bacterium]